MQGKPVVLLMMLIMLQIYDSLAVNLKSKKVWEWKELLFINGWQIILVAKPDSNLTGMRLFLITIYFTEGGYLRLCCKILVCYYRAPPDLTGSVLQHTPFYFPQIQNFGVLQTHLSPVVWGPASYGHLQGNRAWALLHLTLILETSHLNSKSYTAPKFWIIYVPGSKHVKTREV